MQQMDTRAPWALGLVTDRLPIAPPAWARVELDPATQTARYTDPAGQPVQMGGHGTNKTTGTTTTSGGSDGKNPTPQTNDDSNVDYTSD